MLLIIIIIIILLPSGIAIHGIRCGLLLPMSRVRCVYSLGTAASCAKSAEPIKMSFGLICLCGPKEPVIRWGGRFPGGGAVLGVQSNPLVACTNLPILNAVLANVGSPV